MRARFLVLAGLRAASPCFNVVLLDSFGDGWQGAAVVVTRAKDALSPPLLVGQLASGYSETVELCLADGCYDVAVGDDLYASEVSVVVMADTESPARTTAKAARRSPKLLLSLWSRTDLADSVVSFLPAKAFARLSLVSKPLLEAQPRVVFAAARRRNVAEIFTRACFEVLETSDWRHFRETWTDGLARWTMPDPLLPQYHFGIAGTPPQLELERHSYSGHCHEGLFRQFSDVGARRVKRFRMQVAIEEHGFGENEAVGYFIICGKEENAANRGNNDSQFGPERKIGAGLFFSNIYGDGEMQLKWLMQSAEGVNESKTLAESVLVGEVYTIDASFSYGNDHHRDACIASVSVNGGPPTSVPGRLRPLSALHLYNLYNGTARYGDIDVWYE